MLDLCQQLLGGESWIVVEIAIKESLIDDIESENMYHVP